MTNTEALAALRALLTDMIARRDGGQDWAGEVAHHVALAQNAAIRGMVPSTRPDDNEEDA